MNVVPEVDLSPLMEVLDAEEGDAFSFSTFDGPGAPRSAQFRSQEDAEDWLGSVYGQACYLTPNPTRAGVVRAKDTDVLALRHLGIDVDPAKSPDDPDGLEGGKRDKCEEVARRIWRDLLERGFVMSSGRGFWCVLRVAEDVDRYRLRCWIRKTYSVKGVAEIDPLGEDPSRLMRCPGTVNPRTQEVAEILETPSGQLVTQADVEAWTEGWEPPSRADVDSWDDSEPTGADLARLSGTRAGEFWADVDAFGGDRSKRLFAFVSELLKGGAEEGAACRLAVALPGGKFAEDSRGSDYWASTLRSVRAGIEETEREEAAEADALATLYSVLGGDADKADKSDAVFDALDLAAGLDTKAYSRLRLAVKVARCVPLADWEKEVMRAKKAKRRAGAEAAGPPDSVARRLVDEAQKVIGWVKANDGGELLPCEIRSYLSTKLGEDVAQVAHTAAIDAPWEVVSEPFSPRSLEGRRWNMSRAQWLCAPDQGTWPTWLAVLDRWGRGLDEFVALDPWCVEHGIASGGEYVFAWLACMAQFPAARVAWLFIFSRRERSGKSTIPELLAECLLSSEGVADAAGYFMGERPFFTREMRGAVLLMVEEVNIAKSRKTAVPRFKTLVAAPYLSAEFKMETSFRMRNVTHVVQTANYADYAPIDPGDTRITAWEMAELRDDEKTTKAALAAACASEAPAFLHALLAAAVPPGDGRLRVPAVETDLKGSQQDASESLLGTWLREHPSWVTMTPDALYLGYSNYAARLGEPERFRRRQSILRAIDSTGTPAERRLWKLAKAITTAGGFSRLKSGEVAEQFGGASAVGLGRDLASLARVGAPISSVILKGSTLWSWGGDA